MGNFFQNGGGASVPTGTVVMYGGSSAPLDWLLLDGSAVSRTTYANLFAVLSTTYGVGDGSTTFNLPNAQGVFVRGAGSQTISAISYSGTRGTSQVDALQGHLHGTQDSAGSGGNALIGGVGSVSNNGTHNRWTSPVDTSVSDGSNGTPRVSSETRPANICLSYIIKT